MSGFLASDLFLLTLTVALFCLGGSIYRRTRLALLHPVLLTFVAMIVFLQATGIPYRATRKLRGCSILRWACRWWRSATSSTNRWSDCAGICGP